MKLRDQTPGAYGILEEQSGSDDTPRDALAVPAAVGHFDSDKAPTKDRVDAKISVLMR